MIFLINIFLEARSHSFGKALCKILLFFVNETLLHYNIIYLSLVDCKTDFSFTNDKINKSETMLSPGPSNF